MVLTIKTVILTRQVVNLETETSFFQQPTTKLNLNYDIVRRYYHPLVEFIQIAIICSRQISPLAKSERICLALGLVLTRPRIAWLSESYSRRQRTRQTSLRRVESFLIPGNISIQWDLEFTPGIIAVRCSTFTFILYQHSLLWGQMFRK